MNGMNGRKKERMKNERSKKKKKNCGQTLLQLTPVRAEMIHFGACHPKHTLQCFPKRGVSGLQKLS